MSATLETPQTERPGLSAFSSWQTAPETPIAPTTRRLGSGNMATIVDRLNESESGKSEEQSDRNLTAPNLHNQRFSSSETISDANDAGIAASGEDGVNNKSGGPDLEKSGREEQSQEQRGQNQEADLEKGQSQASNDSDEKDEKDPNLVEWDGADDPGNPQNWPFMKKALATGALSCCTLCITFASSVFSTATIPTAMEFGVSEEVMILGTSLFVLGFAVGPMVFGPLSELYGRKIPLFAGFFVFAIFQIPVAVAVNIETIMLCRFVGGLFGSSALSIIGGALNDFWGPVDRGVAICFFAGATFLGPTLGPIIGSFLTQSYLGWRWTAWITLIMAAFLGTIAVFAYPESYAPRLLQLRAKKLRFETKNWAIHAQVDEQQVSFKSIVAKFLGRPFAMIFKEPILDLITVYMALIYGILYLFFEAYPIAFEDVRGYSLGVGSLPFLSIIVGVVLGSSIIIYMTRTRFARKLEESGGKPVPEERLPAMIIGGILFPIGLFWFAWTSNPEIIWVPQVLAGIPIGAGVLMIFMQGLNYIIDVYMMHANSAIAANTFLRSLAGAGFPLFATPMFKNLGVDWASSLLGFLAVACIPFPVLFFIYGPRIRKLSKYSPT